MLLVVVMFMAWVLPAVADVPVWQQKGENLHYNIYLTFIKAGEAELIYTPNKEQNYTIQSNAWTTSGIKSFFKLKDTITIQGKHTIHTGFLPNSYTLKLAENDYRADKNVIYNRGNREVIYTNVWGKQAPRSFSVEANTRDMISALYFLRSIKGDAKVGDKFSLPVFDLDKPYLMVVKVLSKEDVEINGHEVSTLHIQPVLKGVSEKRTSDKWHIWVTDDGNFTPVKIKVKMKVGSFKAVLDYRKIAGKKVPFIKPKDKYNPLVGF